MKEIFRMIKNHRSWKLSGPMQVIRIPWSDPLHTRCPSGERSSSLCTADQFTKSSSHLIFKRPPGPSWIKWTISPGGVNITSQRTPRGLEGWRRVSSANCNNSLWLASSFTAHFKYLRPFSSISELLFWHTHFPVLYFTFTVSLN